MLALGKQRAAGMHATPACRLIQILQLMLHIVQACSRLLANEAAVEAVYTQLLLVWTTYKVLSQCCSDLLNL